MNVLDLFSGIGGFSLGLERAGMRTVAFCEVDPYCRAVLRKHWPDVPIFGDIRTLTAEALADTNRGRQRRPLSADEKHRSELQSSWSPCDDAGTGGIDVICGGFPCQDISVAGKGAGIAGERSGLWSEYARIIGEVRPRYVIVENVAALLGRGLGRVLGDLATLRYDAEWHCIPASAVGAPHRRDRLWIVAHSDDHRQLQQGGAVSQERRWARDSGLRYTDSPGLSPSWQEPVGTYWRNAGGVFAAAGWWSTEPDVGRVAHGVSNRVDRLRALGNAVVPQIPEIIGRAIMEQTRNTG